MPPRAARPPVSTQPMPASAAQPGPTGTRTAAAPAVLQEVFLSPRVVDREAFNDFSQSLRALMTEAQGQARSLRVACEEAAAAQASIGELAGRHQARFETAARVLATLDERSTQAERLLGASRDAASTLDAMRSDAERMSAEHSRTLRARLDEALVAAEVRMAEFERASQARAAAFERSLAERIDAGLRRMDEHAAAAAGALTAREHELRDLMGRLDDLAAETEALLGHAASGPTDLGDGDVGATPAPLPGSLADLLARSHAAAERLERARADAERSLGEGVRAGLARELSALASGIQRVAERARHAGDGAAPR